MSKVAVVLAVVTAMGLVVSIAVAQEKAEPSTLTGTVVSVTGNNVVVKTGEGEAAKNVTVVTDENTVVTIDGKEAAVADLKAGMEVIVTPAEGTATKIEAKTPEEETE